MRITNQMMNNQVLRNLNTGMGRLADLNQQLSTGKRVSRPHEDPVLIRKSMSLNSNLTEIEQYTRNLDQGLSWLESTDIAMNQIDESLHKAQELAIRGANSTLTPEDMETVAEEVNQIYEHILSLSETQYDDMYIFSGTNTSTPPYELTGTPPTLSTYQGATDEIKYEIGDGVEIAVNVNGQDLFEDIFTALEELETHLRTGDQAAIDGDIGLLNDALDNTLSLQSKVGAAYNRFDLTKTRLSDENVNITSLLSKNEDVDIAEVIMNLNMQESVYEASLGSATRVLQPTLLDFIG